MIVNTLTRKKLFHILLVEDDEVDVMNVERAFKKNNLKNPLHVARDGVEALEMLRNTDPVNKLPDSLIVLLDINMPRMNGIEFLREVRKDPELRSLRTFVLTTSDNDRDKLEAFNLNVAGYILKPLSFEKFVKSVEVLNKYWELCEM